MLRILLYAPEMKLPVHQYGGSERVLCWLARALEQHHCRVQVLCAPGSTIENRVDRIPDDIDLVHAFSHQTDSFEGKPWIYTLHGNAKPREQLPLNTVFISKNHADRHGGTVYVHNGVDTDAYRIGKKTTSTTCFLGKASWRVKNVKGAILVADQAGLPIRIMGGWRLSLRSRVKWLGLVSQDRKVDELAEATHLINPIRWHEPFGLAVIEALLSGCAVVATPYGSMPELVSPSVGFLSTQAQELAGWIRHSKVDPRHCRDWAAAHFSSNHMAESYLHVYERVLNGKTLHVNPPELVSHEDPETLLPWDC